MKPVSYLVVLMSALVISYVASAAVPNKSDLSILLGIVFLSAITLSATLSIKSLHNIRDNLSKTTKGILDKLYMGTITIAILAIVSAMDIFSKNGIISMSNWISISNSLKFSFAVLYFYITYDTIRDLKSLPAPKTD